MKQKVNLTKIGSSIRKIREIKGLKQENVAQKLGLTTNGYGKIERGESQINLERLNQIAEIFHVSPNDILDFNENTVYNFENMNNSAPNGTVNNYSSSEDERQLFLNQITALNHLVEKQTKLIELLIKKNETK
jgi:transcriptional regulator with XRE-family HTH domain